MKNKSQNSWLGLILIILGVYLVLNMLFDFSINLEGAWTLFIIIPSALALKKEGFKPLPAIGLGIGILFFLSARDIISFGTSIKIIIPLALIVWGVTILLGSKTIRKRIADNNAASSHTNDNLPEYSAIFSEQKILCNNEVYAGANINAIMGSALLDLRSAYISEDVVTNCSAIFGGITIVLPDNVNVSVSCIPVFGGINNKAAKRNIPGAPTLYINATCMFGGIDIR